jgi:hypothetical protein
MRCEGRWDGATALERCLHKDSWSGASPSVRSRQQYPRPHAAFEREHQPRVAARLPKRMLPRGNPTFGAASQNRPDPTCIELTAVRDLDSGGAVAGHTAGVAGSKRRVAARLRKAAWQPRRVGALAFTVSLAAGVAVRGSAAETVAAGCPVADLDYDIVAHVVIRNTAFGAANGEYTLGSGTMRLRVRGREEQGSVSLMFFELVNHLTVVVRAPVMSGQIVTLSRTTVSHDAPEGSAQGTISGGVITWTTNVAGYRSDGTIECTGSACGRFGAPAKGVSPLHEARPTMMFNSFTFSADGSTFTMPYALLSKSESPRQTTYLALSGRRVRRTCVATP